MSDKKLVFSCILRSDNHQSLELTNLLEEAKERLDLTNLLDSSGYSALNYAASKNKFMAVKTMIEFVKYDKSEQELT